LHPHRRLLRDRLGGRARANFNLVAPLSSAPAEFTAMRDEDTSGQLDLFGGRDESCAVSPLIDRQLRDLRQGDVDSANDRSSTPTTPTTPGTRTSTTAIRTTGTRTTRTGVARSADGNDAVFSYARVLDAWIACRRHKRNTASALAFEANLEQNLAELREAFADGTYAPGRSICFVIIRPKPREVWAAPFRDRVAHHHLYLAVAERFERAFIADSCACIPGRGTLYAARRLEAKVRSITRNWKRPAYYLKCDLANFFVSIDKHQLRDLLAARIGEPELMDLAERILFHDPRTDVDVQSPPERLALVPKHKSLLTQPADRGLPIGNLSSQFFANVLLDPLDQHVKHRMRVRHYIRYVDDFILLHESAQQLNAWRSEIEAFLTRLGVQLNPAKTVLQPIERGIDFVGHLIKPHRRTIRPRTVRAALARVAAMPAEDLYRSANSYFGLLRQASHSHHDRTLLANLVRERGHSVDHRLTKAYE
jgi:retron-type reverse transcriptase